MSSVAIGVLLLCAAGAAPPPAKGPGKIGGNFAVQAIKDIAYREGTDADPVKHRLDLYLPKGHRDFPVLFFVHGGTWRSGDKRTYAPLGQTFARNGVGVVITNYRLSPRVKHPAHIEDVAGAFAWAYRNIGKYGGRTDRLFVCGHSAGGHLAALLATDESYLRAEKLSFASIKGVLALSGVYQIVPYLFSSQFGNDATVCRKASPLSNVNGKHAPFLIVYADRDYPLLGSLAKQMGRALQKARCEAEVVEIKDRDHISIMRKLATDANDPATQLMLKFLARQCGLALALRGPSQK